MITDVNILKWLEAAYQEIYFSEHEAIKLDTKTNTWISAVSRIPNSQNDVIFEAEGKWSEFSSANFYSEEVLQYCIYNNSSSRQYGVFIYENGVLRVETEW